MIKKTEFNNLLEFFMLRKTFTAIAGLAVITAGTSLSMYKFKTGCTEAQNGKQAESYESLNGLCKSISKKIGSWVDASRHMYDEEPSTPNLD